MQVDQLEKKVESLEVENQRLRDMIVLMNREQFGTKSERVEELPLEQLLFNEIEREAANLPTEQYETIAEHTRKKGRGKKKPFPDHLEREEKIIDLTDEEKICPHDGTRLKEIGEEVTEKFKTIPAQMSVIVYRKKKYACPCCDSYLKQAKTNSILPGTIATPELLSTIIFSKFFQSLPLYRQQEQFKLNGVDLTRATMGRWLVQVSEKLIPLWNCLEEKAIDSGYMAIDATTIQVLKEEDRAAETKSFMWVRGSPELGIVLFDYDPSGAGKVAKRLTEDFKGALQADAHRGYNQLDRKKLTLLGCMMHARRRFHKAWLLGKKKPGIAAEALQMFKWLYDKEDEYREKGLTPHQRKIWRDKEVGPSLLEMKKWCGWQLEKVPPKSPTANALNYFINEYQELSAFLKNGRHEMDNGWVERQIKRFAIGRKNWLFSDTIAGANASSVLYSLTLTAKLNGKDPFKVMTEIFERLPLAKTIGDYERLTDLLLSKVNPMSCRKKEGKLIP